MTDFLTAAWELRLWLGVATLVAASAWLTAGDRSRPPSGRRPDSGDDSRNPPGGTHQ